MTTKAVARAQSLVTLQQLLTNAARDASQAVEYYTNDRVLPGGDSIPIRLLSENRLPANTAFNYIASARAHLNPSEEPRAVTTIVLHPYGWVEDQRRLHSTKPTDRRIRTAPQGTRRRRGTTPTTRVDDGVVALVSNPDYVVPSYATGPNLVCDVKTVSVIQGMTNAQRGPAYHVVITRNGDVYVAASLDDRLAATDVPEARDTTVDIAFEVLLAANRRDHEATTNPASLVLREMPMTANQVLALAVITGKLFAAYPRIGRSIVDAPTAAGFYVQWGVAAVHVQNGNFTNGAWVGTSAFDYSHSDLPGFLEEVTRVGPLDLATEVFRPYSPAPPSTARAQARALFSNIDTLGAEAQAMGAYASLASPDRSYDMQATARADFYVQRARHATGTADAAADAAGGVAAANAASPPSLTVDASTIGPHVYDFTSGLWGDEIPRAY